MMKSLIFKVVERKIEYLRFFFLSYVVLILMTACAPVAIPPQPNPAGFTSNYQGKPIFIPQQTYKIHIGDKLEINFFYNPDLNVMIPVRPDGRISLQSISEVMAAGLTPIELQELLQTAYAEELKQEKITVIVSSFSIPKIYVTGGVRDSRMINLTGNISLLQAIAQAGGFSNTAILTEIVVIRRSEQGQPQFYRFNLKNVLDGIDLSHDIQLIPEDIVFVPVLEQPVATW